MTFRVLRCVTLSFLVAAVPATTGDAALEAPHIHVFSCQVVAGMLVPQRDESGSPFVSKTTRRPSTPRSYGVRSTERAQSTLSTTARLHRTYKSTTTCLRTRYHALQRGRGAALTLPKSRLGCRRRGYVEARIWCSGLSLEPKIPRTARSFASPPSTATSGKIPLCPNPFQTFLHRNPWPHLLRRPSRRRQKIPRSIPLKSCNAY